ncbi:PKD domain-containing protein [Aquimarina macrocephali]|uniref:PKD domain-containing protein n=1 Tax=Aquimarina macrocephali TaxID=666563 RepID=UPI000466D770|nr:PKD domain-containing protein [Aquimarina macrocephali]
MKKITLLLLLLLSIPLIAQRESGYQNNLNYAPSTPEVASLGKFIETPVSLYSGIPNVSIPIGNVSSGSLSLPVSLSYHAGGVKVEETASWTGLGWNLSAGGSVTRVVRGIADDGIGGFLNTTKTVEDFLAIQLDASQINQSTELIIKAVNGELDYEPDMHHYNIPGYSGSFFFKQSGQIITMPHADVRINYLKNSAKKITAWIITAPNGVKYYFGVSQDGTRKGYEDLLGSTSLGGGKNFNAGYTNGWKLMDIEDAISKNYIRFTYTENTYDTCSASGQQRYVNVRGEIDSQILSAGIKPITYYESFISSWKISSIESQNGTIEFIKNTTERLDQPGDYSLKEIVIKDLHGKEVKKINLTYTTVGEIGNSHAVPCSGNDRYYRMFLTSVQESKGLESLPPYSMQYNSKPLPDRFSLAKDLWGYYNGKHSNTILIPSVTLLGIRYEGADRSANSDFAKAGVLEKLTYPTGGYTIFEYEGNTIGQLAFANDIAPRVRHPLVTVSTSDLQNNSIEINKPFTISPGEIVQDFVFIDVTYPCDITQRTCGIQLELIKSDGSTVALATDSSVILPPGNYSIQGTITPNDSGDYPDFRVRVYGEKLDLGSLTTDGVNYEVGGLRVKNIKKYDTDTSYFEKSYEYLNWDGDNTTSSSGGITSTPFFIEKGAVFSNGTLSSADIISSSSNNPMTTTKSSYVGYRNVTEYFGTKENNTGKKEYKFSFNLDDDSDIDRFPYAPVTVLEWLRGNLEEERIFKKENAGYTLVRKTTNQYKYLRNQNDIFKKEVVGVKMGMRYGFWSSKKYYTLSEWYKLEKTTTKDYFKGKEIVTAKELNYHDNANKHVFPVEEVISTNENEWYYNRSKYPEDLVSKTAAEQRLIDLYRINIPLEKITTRKKGSSPEEIVSKEYFDYKIWEGGKVLPEKIRAAKANTPLKDRVIYHKYNDKGNPLEVSLADGRHIMYVWGYNNTQPVAKIDNASYIGISSTASSLITQLQTASNTEDTAGEEVTMRNLFKNLREDAYFADAQITGYTYDPLIGVTSMTDPKGHTGYYRYDEFNRLEYGLDNDQHIAQQVRYNYQGEQTATLGDVTISPSLSVVQPNQAVTFTANTSGSGGADLFTWSVDGTQEQCDATTSFTKSFSAEGTYTVSIIAYNAENKHRVSKTMNVVVAYPPIVTPIVSANYTNIVKGTTTTFTASSIGGGTGNLRYEWYVNTIKQAGTATTFAYTPNTAGTYTMYFKVIDNTSGKSVNSAIRKLYAYNPITAANVSASKSHIVQGTTTTFFASGIGGGTGSYFFEWFINDVKQSATGTTLSYNFPNSGTYTIKFRLVDRGLENGYYQWGANAPVLKSYPSMSVSTNQSHTSISGANPSVSFNITSLTGGSGSRQISWKVYKTVSPSQILGSGSSTGFSFSNFATGTHEYDVKATVTDNLTGQVITKLMVVIATVSSDTGGGTGEQH